MNKLIGIVVGLIVIIGVVLVSTKEKEEMPANETQLQGTTDLPTTTDSVSTSTATAPKEEQKPATSPKPKAGEYTMTDVGKHANASSCWSAVNGGVYDLTAWIGGHPGGEKAILSICGKDGSAAFNDQHGGKEKMESQLATLKIGTLVA